MIEIKISYKYANQKFNGCDPEYIKNVCHASCCQSTTSKNGTMITIHPSENIKIKKIGGKIKNGFLEPINKKCPFKTDDHLCGLHLSENKPFGCIASPFTLNKNNTLIIRNRYRLLKCYNDGKKIPAFLAFKSSLDLLFGLEESNRIVNHLKNNNSDLIAYMSVEKYKILIENDSIKKKNNIKQINLFSNS